MKNVGCWNGEIDLMENLRIPANDRGMFFGDGAYDATYAANRRIFEADAHIERFWNSCRALRLPLGVSREELRAELQRCVDRLDSEGPALVYWQCTRGAGPRAHRFPEGDKPGNLLVTVEEKAFTPLTRPLRVILAEDTRYYHCNVKTLNLLPNVMASQRAWEAGCDEAVFHRGERVTECAHSNVHILRDGALHTAPTDELILPGITRSHLLRVCERLGVPCVVAPFTVAELFAADEVIVTSAGTLGARVAEVDGQPVGGRDPALLHRLQRAMADDLYQQTGYRLPVEE